MRTIRRLIYSEVLRAVGFVTLAFLLLFFFFDFIDQLGDLNEGAGRGYRLTQALVYVALQVPGHLDELLPIAVLIGTIYVMARLAESSLDRRGGERWQVSHAEEPRDHVHVGGDASQVSVFDVGLPSRHRSTPLRAMRTASSSSSVTDT